MTPEELASKATECEGRVLEPRASDYIETIRILRDEKNFTWLEVQDFLRANGVEFSCQTLTSVWHRHQKRAEQNGNGQS